MFTLAIRDYTARLVLARPPVNAINEEWIALFNARLDEIERRDDVKILHLCSEQKVFCAGADLAQVREWFRSADGPDRMFAFVASIQRLYARIERLPLVTLAEIGGAAMGGGFEITLACDLRVAADEVKLGLPEARLGLIPGAGGTQRLARLCGRSVASRLILGAEVVDGATAATLGIVHWSFQRTVLVERTAEIIRRIASLPMAALAASKSCLAASGEPGRGGFFDEIEATRALLTNTETRARIEDFLAGNQP